MASTTITPDGPPLQAARAEVPLDALADALAAGRSELSRTCDLLLDGAPGRFATAPLSVQEALAVGTAWSVPLRRESLRDASELVRSHWPEIARVVLNGPKGIGPAAGGAPHPYLLIGGGLAPPVHAECWDWEVTPPVTCVLVDLVPVATAVEELAGTEAWRSGLYLLDASFGDHVVELPADGQASDMPRGFDFLTEGPYWRRLQALLAVDWSAFDERISPAATRRLRSYAEYLLRPAPLDQWKREVGTRRSEPRVKHMVEAIADAGGLGLRMRPSPATLRAIIPDEAVALLNAFLEVLCEPLEAAGV